MGSICSDRPRDTGQLPRYIKERAAMWRCGEKEEGEVGGGTEGGREEGGRRGGGIGSSLSPPWNVGCGDGMFSMQCGVCTCVIACVQSI